MTHEHIMNKLWTKAMNSCEQIFSFEEFMKKLWTSHRKTCKDIINKFWTSHGEVVGKNQDQVQGKKAMDQNKFWGRKAMHEKNTGFKISYQ